MISRWPFLLTLVPLLAISNPRSMATESQPDPETQQSLAHAQQLSKAFAWSAQRIRPSVVEISTGRRVNGRSRLAMPNTIVTGTGSGVIVDASGFILTNHHVVNGVQGVVVSLHDGRQFQARIVGSDPLADLAILKIEANDLTAATFADVEDIAVGQWVLAVGSPFGLELTVTAGIVSATGRRDLAFSSRGGYENYIQTDAAINPGSSGGPLVNLQGEVIGINTAIQTRDGGYLGIAFAIPVDMARNVVESLIENGKLARGFLGVTLVSMNSDIRDALNYKGRPGVLVSGIMAGSPADQGGIQRGDVITHLGNQPIVDPSMLRRTIALMEPGEACPLKVFRNGTTNTITVKLIQNPTVQVPPDRSGGSWVND